MDLVDLHTGFDRFCLMCSLCVLCSNEMGFESKTKLFGHFRKIAKSDRYLHVRPSHCTNFHEIWCLNFFVENLYTEFKFY